MLKSIQVRDYMTAALVTLRPDMQILDAVHTLVANRISGAPVVDQHGNLIGLLSELDCMRIALSAGYYEEYGGRVSEFMSYGVKTVDADASILALAEMFLNSKYRRFPVIDEGRLVGQVSRRDVLRALEVLW